MSRKTKQNVAVVKRQAPALLSNGMESTNENWREFARLAFGDNSPAVEYMDLRTSHTSPTAVVKHPEKQMLLMLATIHDHPEMVVQARAAIHENLV